MIVPLFSEEKNEALKESLKDDVNRSLSLLGGFGAGVLAGVATNPLRDAKYQKGLVEKALKETEAKEESKKHWDTLLKLHKGQITIRDLPLHERTFYTNLLEENADDLKYFDRNPQMAKKNLEDMTRGSVKPLFPGAPKSKITKDFLDKVHSPKNSPITAALGLAGLYGGSKLYNYTHEKSEDA